MPPQILVIEDDAALVELLTYNLKAAGFGVSSAGSAEEGSLLLSFQDVDLLVLDWMLPETSGIDLCAALRKSSKHATLPIVMLTARNEEADRIRGLKTGADDYVVKPFSVPELIARISALLRRVSPVRLKNILQHGDLVLDRDAHQVMLRARPISLGPTEFKVLETLLESVGKVLNRAQLIDRVWGNEADIDERTIDVHIGRLRKALVGDHGVNPVRTVRGAGYVLNDVDPG